MMKDFFDGLVVPESTAAWKQPLQKSDNTRTCQRQETTYLPSA
jgi:hypothetical protein